MFGRATAATATVILYASLTTCVLGEEWRPQRQVGIGNVVRNRANYVVVAIVEGPKIIVDGERFVHRFLILKVASTLTTAFVRLPVVLSCDCEIAVIRAPKLVPWAIV